MSEESGRTPSIRLLYSAGCDASRTNEAREALAAALADVGLRGVEVEEILVETEEQSVACGMVGGPAIMVDGVDVDPGVRGMRTGGLGCRAYITSDGVSAAPPVAMIVAALREALGQG